jgi:hypothetical protein
MQRLSLVTVGVSLALAVGIVTAGAGAGNKPLPAATGERAHAQSTLEAVFNAEKSGEIGYVSTPNQTQHPVPSNPKSWSPIYVVEYPTTYQFATDGSGATGPLNCEHYQGTPETDNCPSHGNDLAGIAHFCLDSSVVPAPNNPCDDSTTAAAVQNVYQYGEAGHDHVMDFHGGADWNVAWEPILVLFTDADYANNNRLLTDSDIATAVADGKAVEMELPFATFHCAQVSKSVWALSSDPVIG